MTDTDYYYTTQLGYADFAVKQGFEGVCSIIMGQRFIGLYLNADAYDFPKTPHNVALMDCRLGDLVHTPNSIQSHKIINIHELRDYLLQNGDYVIISRNINGKPVPMPIWDKEGV